MVRFKEMDSPKILLVDDEEIDREIASRCLRALGELRLNFARNGEEALESISQGAPDLVVTDLRMPVMDGLELVERMSSEFPSVPVILITSQGNEKIAVRALRAGAASYVPKRELREDLANTVREVLEVAKAKSSQRMLLKYMVASETRFELANDPGLIPHIIGFLQESLERRSFGNEHIRTQVGIALMEALSNAMIHGNLELGSELRRSDILQFERLLVERRQRAPYIHRSVHLIANELPERVQYVVEDQGNGFKVESLPDPTRPENLLNVSGRGVMLIRTFMDSVEFNERGNQITMTKLADFQP